MGNRMAALRGFAHLVIGVSFTLGLAHCGPADDDDSSTAGSGGTAGNGGTAGGGGSSGASAACGADPTPKAGKPAGTVMLDIATPPTLVPTLGAAARVVDDGVTPRWLMLRITDYGSVCDYMSAGLYKESGSDLILIIKPKNEDIQPNVYVTAGDGEPAYVAASPAPMGEICLEGDVLAGLENGTVSVTELDGTHVVVDVDLTPGLVRVKGTIDAPLCPGPDECGCAP